MSNAYDTWLKDISLSGLQLFEYYNDSTQIKVHKDAAFAENPMDREDVKE